MVPLFCAKKHLPFSHKSFQKAKKFRPFLQNCPISKKLENTFCLASEKTQKATKIKFCPIWDSSFESEHRKLIKETPRRQNRWSRFILDNYSPRPLWRSTLITTQSSLSPFSSEWSRNMSFPVKNEGKMNDSKEWWITINVGK